MRICRRVASNYVINEIVTVVLVRAKSTGGANISGKLINESTTISTVNYPAFGSLWSTFRNQKSTRFSFTDYSILSLITDNHVNQLTTSGA
ncbi:MAG: hypothetical protein LVQ96_04065 [Thermoplasmatales archaeon]|nr:hypothetical protein [Thermoplasmatales archaeon]